MAISMNGSVIDLAERESLKNSEVDLSITGNAGSTSMNGGVLVGVTAEFASKFTSAMDSYITDIKNKLAELDLQASKSNAFQGEGIQSAITNFITSVQEVATGYLDKLNLAEQNIIDSVQQTYTSQDTSISSDISGDASTLSNSI